MGTVVQVIGSLLVLAGFTLAQRGLVDQKSVAYLTVNLLGSGILAVDALIGQQWGFLLLESVWAVVSGLALIGVLLRPRGNRHPRPAR